MRETHDQRAQPIERDVLYITARLEEAEYQDDSEAVDQPRLEDERDNSSEVRRGVVRACGWVGMEVGGRPASAVDTEHYRACVSQGVSLRAFVGGGDEKAEIM